MGFPAASCLIRRRHLHPTPPLPDDLVDAIEALLTSLMLAPTGPLTWIGAGLAPPGQDLPYLSYGEPDEDDALWSTTGGRQCEGHLAITCYASAKKKARALGDSVSAILRAAALAQQGASTDDPELLAVMPSLPSNPLLFAAGSLFLLQQPGRTLTLDPDPAPEGGNCWVETRQFHFMYSH
jgi:Protein of unknown function (DUF3168)